MISEKDKIQQEALEALRKNGYNGIVILPTGTGKSLILIQALKELYKEGMSVLYTCDSKKLRDEGFNTELEKWGCSGFKDRIDKKCYATTRKFEGRHYNILLADEADYAMTPEYSKTFFNNTFDHIILVSATMDYKKFNNYAGKIAPIVYKKTVKDVEEKKVVNKSQFITVPYKLTKHESSLYNIYSRKIAENMQWTSNEEEKIKRKKRLEFFITKRRQTVQSFNSSAWVVKRLIRYIKFINPKAKILIFCGLTDQADKICKYSYHGKNEKEDWLKKFDEGEIDVCAVCGKIDRGINIKGVNVIILESVSSSETPMIQRIGRGKRLDVDDVLDVYVPIPYYHTDGKYKATVVSDWLRKAGKNIGIDKAKTLILK